MEEFVCGRGIMWWAATAFNLFSFMLLFSLLKGGMARGLKDDGWKEVRRTLGALGVGAVYREVLLWNLPGSLSEFCRLKVTALERNCPSLGAGCLCICGAGSTSATGAGVGGGESGTGVWVPEDVGGDAGVGLDGFNGEGANCCCCFWMCCLFSWTRDEGCCLLPAIFCNPFICL